MQNLNIYFKTKPFFLFLLPIWFGFHGYYEHFDLVPTKDVLLLTAFYLGIAILLAGLGWLIYKNFYKANLLAFCILLFQLFFGAIHDTLKNIFPETFIIKYSFLIPTAFIFFLFILFLLKKRKGSLLKVTQYLNLLLILLIIIDVGLMFFKSTFGKPGVLEPYREFLNCDSCLKPDIYLIVADEYAGNKELKDIFKFDNSQFENELKNRGFFIIENSVSNYNSTVFSVASTLDMDFIHKNKENGDDDNLSTAYRLINENHLTRFLHAQNYEIKNYSVFHFDDKPPLISSTFVITGVDLIKGQTFTGRMNRDIRFNLITRFKIRSEMERFVKYNVNSDKLLINKTKSETSLKSNRPRFIYLHVMMPHFPYYIDKNGHYNEWEMLNNSTRFKQEKYIEYLQYGNHVFLDLIDEILKQPQKPIVVLMGDHGFRHFETDVDTKYHFMNFNSVFLPGHDYSKFYDTMSSVNEFRLILNTQFNQHLPLLKDSTIFIKNWW